MEVVTAGEDLMAQAIAAFVPLLEKRLNSGIFTTEDSVRYTFFAALLHTGVQPEQVVLEAPYRDIDGARLDMLINSPSKAALAAAEFKYDRAMPGGRNLPLTHKAGKLFADLRRLLLWHEHITLYFVYPTDRTMYNHLYNAGDKVPAIFMRSPIQEYHITADSFSHPAGTFHKAMGNWTDPATLRIRVNMDLPNDHHLWIFSIQHTDQLTTDN